MPWPWGGNCGVVDFTNPKVADWWGAYQQKAIVDGVRGFWTDMGEPAWSNEESTDRLNMTHYLGKHNEIHNVYGLTWDKVVTEQFEKHNPNTRIFQMTRAAFAGVQRYAFGWSGDTGDGNNVLDGWKNLEAQLPMALSAGMGGIPFWSCDISGYCGDIKDYNAMSELYVRWMQFGVFNPISRAHHEGNNAVEPWLFGTEAEELCKKAIEQKYRLFPYLYSCAREAHDNGMPVMRALMLEYPDDNETTDLNSEFLFGPSLLIAPVMEQGAVVKKVYLPDGEWIDFNNTQNVFQGKQWIEYPVELKTIPMFVKSGSIISTMPIIQYINEKTDYLLIIDIFPAAVNKKSQSDIYEDDGETNNYKADIFVKRSVQCPSFKDRIEIIYSEKAENGYTPEKRNLVYQIHMKEAPVSVSIADKKLKSFRLKPGNDWLTVKMETAEWNWNKENNTLTVCMPSEIRDEKITIHTGK
jgi:alpha-glucosidase